jgi:tRNA threonylcarbamoyladenosine biosynthesis protein TsaE
MHLLLPDPIATRQLGIQLGQQLPTGSVLLLKGDLGSGKTTLVQGIGAGLGITEAIESPTFTLINEYLAGRIPLYHLDLYRLDATEAAGLSPEIYWEGTEVELGIMAIEWADRLPYLPSDYLELHLLDIGDAGRQVNFSTSGEFALPARLKYDLVGD